MKREQLNTLISILEQRGGISLTDRDIVIKITGGIRIKEQAANLAVIMSMVSSLKIKAIPADTIFIADVSLTGELQKVPSMEMRIKEAERMGYKSIYIASSALEKNTFSKGIKIIGLKSLKEVIKSVFA
jgi:DNA repair protein RadA/Sms